MNTILYGKDPENPDRSSKSDWLKRERAKSEQAGRRKSRSRESDYARRLRVGFEMLDHDREE